MINIRSVVPILALLIASAIPAFSQGGTIGKMSYKDMEGWQKKVSQESVVFNKLNEAGTAVASVTLVNTNPSAGSIEEDLDTVWSVTVKNLGQAQERSVGPAEKANGWESISAAAKSAVEGSEFRLAVFVFRKGGIFQTVVVLGSKKEEFEAAFGFIDQLQFGGE